LEERRSLASLIPVVVGLIIDELAQAGYIKIIGNKAYPREKICSSNFHEIREEQQ